MKEIYIVCNQRKVQTQKEFNNFLKYIWYQMPVGSLWNTMEPQTVFWGHLPLQLMPQALTDRKEICLFDLRQFMEVVVLDIDRVSFYKKIILYGSIINVQCCIGVKWAKWFSCKYTYIYSFFFLFRFFSSLGYYRKFNRVPCAI